jgi:hypothetical protein
VQGADRLILRNLELISDRTVVAVDEDGARFDAPLSDGRDRVTWDEIERGRVSSDLQPQFDRFHRELGPPLYKLRQRLRIGDYPGLTETAEKIYPVFAARKSQTAYLVCQSLMWGRLAQGRREEAVEPMLRCVLLLGTGAADADRLPGNRRLARDGNLPLCFDLPPLWLDRRAAQAALPALQNLVNEIPAPRPAEVYVYLASLAAAAGQHDLASRSIDAIPASFDGPRQVRLVMKAALEVQQGKPEGSVEELRLRRGELPPSLAPLAHFWIGLALVQAPELDVQNDGLLELLTIPAEYGREQGEMAAAALHQAALILENRKDGAGRAAVLQELTSRHGATAVGVQWSKMAANAKSD